ncbi:MAG: GWxTD domain-containing protein, partial [bacterium]|nr:GWxTD domain-containing protein [bacterium]
MISVRRQIQLFLFFIVVFTTADVSFSQSSYYERGKAALEQGLWIRALEIWGEGRTALELEGKSDPRIGIEYLETVLEQNKDLLLEKGLEFYLWGFSGNNSEEYFDTITQEAERIIPLLPDGEAEELRTLLENSNNEISRRIIGFWVRNDPTPETEYNEKLIEHWNRIAYARKTFTKNTNSVYGCDDRGALYVKYGEPARRREGTFGMSYSELEMVLGAFEPTPGQPKIRLLKKPHGLIVSYSEIESILLAPEYDVWVYDNLNKEQSLLYYFGKPAMGSFGMLESLEELIPDRAYANNYYVNVMNVRSNRADDPLISLGGLIQLQLYSQMMTLDNFFSSRYNDLNSEWQKCAMTDGLPPNPGVIRGFRGKHTNEDKNNPAKMDAPKTISDFEASITTIPIIYTQLRKLDENNEPKIAVVAMSFPGIQENIPVIELLAKEDFKQDYVLTHTVKIHDENWKEVDRLTDVRDESHDNTSLFLIDHNSASNNYILTARAEPKNNLLVKDLQIGKSILDPIEPLSTDLAELEISDIIAGVPTPENLINKNYPFPVVPAPQLFNEDPLMIYIEVYHLNLGSDGRAHFDVEFSYEILKKRRFRSDKIERVSQQFPFQSTSTTAKEMAGFDVS